MSYVLDGKISNQKCIEKLNGQVTCEKCNQLIDKPKLAIVNSPLTNENLKCNSYIRTEHFVYETKKGYAIVYCSDYCRRKHNHRFN
jgi:hypothetical protein